MENNIIFYMKIKKIFISLGSIPLKDFVEEKRFFELVKQVMNIEMKIGQFEEKISLISKDISLKTKEISERFEEKINFAMEAISKNTNYTMFGTQELKRNTNSSFHEEEKKKREKNLSFAYEDNIQKKVDILNDDLNEKFSQMVKTMDNLGQVTRELIMNFDENSLNLNRIEEDLFKLVNVCKELNDQFNIVRPFSDEIEKIKFQISGMKSAMTGVFKVNKVETF